MSSSVAAGLARSPIVLPEGPNAPPPVPSSRSLFASALAEATTVTSASLFLLTVPAAPVGVVKIQLQITTGGRARLEATPPASMAFVKRNVSVGRTMKSVAVLQAPTAPAATVAPGFVSVGPTTATSAPLGSLFRALPAFVFPRGPHPQQVTLKQRESFARIPYAKVWRSWQGRL